MAEENCPICSTALAPFFRSASFLILVCSNCGLGITKGASAQVSDYHRDDVYQIEEKLFSNIFEKRFNLIKKYLKEGSVLEIGCSTGLLLKFFKDANFKTLGIDISIKSLEVAKNRGINVSQVGIEELKTDQKFNLIILNHTLEHLENPILVIKKATAMLNSKGLLLIAVPNFTGLSARILKEKWPSLLPSEHLWHFTQKSLKLILEQSGLEILSNQTFSGVWDMEHPLSELREALMGGKKRFFIEILTLIPDLLLSRLNLGSGIIAIAKKR